MNAFIGLYSVREHDSTCWLSQTVAIEPPPLFRSRELSYRRRFQQPLQVDSYIEFEASQLPELTANRQQDLFDHHAPAKAARINLDQIIDQWIVSQDLGG